MTCVHSLNDIDIKLSGTSLDPENLIETNITKHQVSGSILIVSGQITPTNESVHIAEIDMQFDGFDFPANTRIFTRDQTMNGNVKLFDLKNVIFTLESEVYCIFEISRDEYILVGQLSWDIFLGKFKIEDYKLSLEFFGDGKSILKGQKIDLEKVVIIKGKSSQEVLEKYANVIADKFNIKCKDVAWRGWGSWDYYADQFGEKEILDNLNYLNENNFNCNLIQIDDGYCVWGDWLDVKGDTFPNGIKGINDTIQKAGYSPGIWMSPFLAAKDSKLFKEHPDWFLYDDEGKPLVDMVSANINYVLDYSKYEVCNWLYRVLRTMKDDWGVKYFKLDFLERGIWPCRSADEGVTPLERFHRCFKSVKAALGDEVYILGCSATLGPSIGYVDGMRTGPDVSPDFNEIRKTANCSVRNWFLDKKVFNCDADYLVLRSHEDEDNDHCGKGNKVGKLSLIEAKTWAHFISIYGNAGIMSDKLPVLRNDRVEIFKQLCKQKPSQKCVPLDFWNGDGGDVPCCYLCMNDDGVTLNIFNWNDETVVISLGGFLDNDNLVNAHSENVIEIINNSISITVVQHSSKQLRYAGERSFEELKNVLHVKSERNELSVTQICGEKFSYNGKVVQFDLGENAKSPLPFNRFTARGMLNGRFSELLNKDSLLAIPFNFSPEYKAIEISTSNNPHNTTIEINDKLKTLYILHTCEYPVKGYLNNYNVKYKDRTEEINIYMAEHVGNSSAQYSLPWNGSSARIAWHNPQNDACLYLMEWNNPHPEETINEVEITWPEQRANLFIVGIAGVKL